VPHERIVEEILAALPSALGMAAARETEPQGSTS
jgi:hypothetical protein